MKRLVLAGCDDETWRAKLIKGLNELMVFDIFDCLTERARLKTAPEISSIENLESGLINNPDTVVLYVNTKLAPNRYSVNEIVRRHTATPEGRTIFWFSPDFYSNEMDKMGAALSKAGVCWMRATWIEDLPRFVFDYMKGCE